MECTSGPDSGGHRNDSAGRSAQENGRLGEWGPFYAARRVRTHLADPNLPTDLRRHLPRSATAHLPAGVGHSAARR